MSSDNLCIALPTCNAWTSWPVAAFQILIVWSYDPKATSFESLEKATDVTESLTIGLVLIYDNVSSS